MKKKKKTDESYPDFTVYYKSFTCHIDRFLLSVVVSYGGTVL